jgi:hypothetical protein
MAGELASEGITIQAVEARASVRDRLRLVGADAKLGGINRFRSVADVLEPAPDASTEPAPAERTPAEVTS